MRQASFTIVMEALTFAPVPPVCVARGTAVAELLTRVSVSFAAAVMMAEPTVVSRASPVVSGILP